jgi:hypothetical protein
MVLLRNPAPQRLAAAISSTAFCRELALVGVDCALLAAAEAGGYPRIILGDGSGASVLIDGGG